MLDYRIHTFLKVCETLNYTLAAKQLHITQPAVSQHIHYLEQEYETTLFVYSNKQLSLTRSGEILRKYLMTMQNDEQTIKKEIKSHEGMIETLSIGVTMTIGEYAIVDKLADFIKHHPEMNLHLYYGNTAELLKLLDQGKIHMAIVEGNYPKEKYSHKKYSTEDYIAVCAASHEFKNIPHTLHDLLDERLLVREQGSGTRHILQESLNVRGLSISDFKFYTQIENMHTIISLLKKDCGISFMYKTAVKEELQKGILKEIILDDFKLQHNFEFIWEKDSLFTDKYISISEEFLTIPF